MCYNVNHSPKPHTLTGWWFVSNGTDEGWAPCSYLENINGGDEEEVAVSSLGTLRRESVCLRVRVLHE